MAKFDFRGVEPWTGGGDVLPNGKHEVTITEAEEVQGKNFPQWKLRFENEQGGITGWQSLSPKSMGFVMGLLMSAGIVVPDGEFEFNPSGLVGRKVSIYVGPKQKPDGSTISEVKSINPPADLDVNGPSIPAAGGDDDDLPF